jgi:two-component system cell cycle sensor histidine kinase/response regulator CckA
MSTPQVLLAEDDGSLRGILVAMLNERGVEVLEAGDGMEASQMLKDNSGISLLLSDVKMPRMDGYALVEEALKRNSELKVVMMTGYPGDQPPPAVLRAREIRTLVKPFDMDRMCNLIVDMLARP